ncbi:hypothetical protein JHL18_05035 [Clostridium sp. YIM B02505]|uniref:Uncharacterized protein n=1 Tax=Clostridium yunnanense TaxID=2800325 RepID=A0ABS1EKW2_9CLOT|nr:permease prefix domain 1-containing protein [Clostridium yunnanense]MBK1810007.1 hypothetical protein [Clostridium yunnanense]
MFQLEKSLIDWKKKLSASNSLTSSDIEELESHLLDEIDALKKKTLTEEEAFYVACSRLGSVDLLTSEYSIVNSNFLWIKKFLWLLTGYLIISFSQKLTASLTLFITTSFFKEIDLYSNELMYISLAINTVLSLIVLCILFLPRFQAISYFQAKFNYLLVHRKWLLVLVFIAFIFMNTVGFSLLSLPIFRKIQVYQMGYISQGQNYSALIWTAILCLLFILFSFRNYKKQIN